MFTLYRIYTFGVNSGDVFSRFTSNMVNNNQNYPITYALNSVHFLTHKHEFISYECIEDGTYGRSFKNCVHLSCSELIIIENDFVEPKK